MATIHSIRSLTRVARYTPFKTPTTTQPLSLSFAASFSTSQPQNATPSGPPPANFRLPRPKRWDEQEEKLWDRLGNYFLMTEIVRGMYVVMEQFFRPA